MQLDTIGKNIRRYRLMKKFRQEDLAEKAGLTTNYIGMVERGEKIPSLETFIKILNALEVSSDMVLTDVLETGYTVKNSILNEKLAKLAPEDRSNYPFDRRFFSVRGNLFPKRLCRRVCAFHSRPDSNPHFIYDFLFTHFMCFCNFLNYVLQYISSYVLW